MKATRISTSLFLKVPTTRKHPHAAQAVRQPGYEYATGLVQLATTVPVGHGGMPYLHPVSPCPLYDWKGTEAGSGSYFAMVHNTFDFNADTAWQNRGPLYLIAGTFQSAAEQPIWFAPPKLFMDRPSRNSFYTSSTQVNGKCMLWYNDMKYYLLGKVIDEEWFEGIPHRS